MTRTIGYGAYGYMDVESAADLTDIYQTENKTMKLIMSFDVKDERAADKVHSLLSAMINNGLVDPQSLIEVSEIAVLSSGCQRELGLEQC